MESQEIIAVSEAVNLLITQIIKLKAECENCLSVSKEIYKHLEFLLNDHIDLPEFIRKNEATRQSIINLMKESYLLKSLVEDSLFPQIEAITSGFQKSKAQILELTDSSQFIFFEKNLNQKTRHIDDHLCRIDEIKTHLEFFVGYNMENLKSLLDTDAPLKS